MRLSENWEEWNKTPSLTHSFQKVDGILALDRNRVVEETKISIGDTVSWFELPDGKLLLSKDPEGVPIEKISSAYYHLDADVTVEEK